MLYYTLAFPPFPFTLNQPVFLIINIPFLQNITLLSPTPLLPYHPQMDSSLNYTSYKVSILNYLISSPESNLPKTPPLIKPEIINSINLSILP
jgi:hypothetical protein